MGRSYRAPVGSPPCRSLPAPARSSPAPRAASAPRWPRARRARRDRRASPRARPTSPPELAAQLPGRPPRPRLRRRRHRVRAAAIATFAELAGGIDLLVANAGITHYGPYRHQSLEQQLQMSEVNWHGTLRTVHLGLPYLLDRANGHVVVVSSGAALRSFPWAAVYGGTKAAQRMFAEALRHELSGTGVSLTTVYPGEIATHLHDHEKDPMPDWYRGGPERREPGRARAAGPAGRRARRPRRLVPADRAPARRAAQHRLARRRRAAAAAARRDRGAAQGLASRRDAEIDHGSFAAVSCRGAVPGWAAASAASPRAPPPSPAAAPRSGRPSRAPPARAARRGARRTPA